jgi:hypothetical protein
MTELEQPSRYDPLPAPDAASVLPYRAGRDDFPEARRAVGQVIGGAILAVITVCGVVAFWIMANLDLSPPPHPNPPLNWKVPTIITIIAASFLSLVTLVVTYRRGKRSFALGVLIGIGLSALIEGICFSGVFR